MDVNSFLPEVFITGFRLFNQEVPVAMPWQIDSFENNRIFHLPKHIRYMDKIILKHDQGKISFEFAALNFLNPQKNQYAYKLEGFEKTGYTAVVNVRLHTPTYIPGLIHFG